VQGVAKNFREIFAELVPGGRGELVMQKRLHPDLNQEAQQEEDEEAGNRRQDVSEKYSGVKVKVSLSSCLHLKGNRGNDCRGEAYCGS
jgi:structural maintenance of chromosome 3 (chondroitin sulfate proteoglycan 6)